MNKYEAFLTELSEKHGVIISGCGCCGSPMLDDFDDLDDATTWYWGDITGGHYEVGEDGCGLLEWVNSDEVQEILGIRTDEQRVENQRIQQENEIKLRESRAKLAEALDER